MTRWTVGVLKNDFFVNLTDIDLVWEKVGEDGVRFALKDRAPGHTKFTAARNDLVFGSTHHCAPLLILCLQRRASALRQELYQGVGQGDDA